jgi:hypothetical protein
LPDLSQKDLAATYTTLGVDGVATVASTLKKEFRKTPNLTDAAKIRRYKEVLVSTAESQVGTPAI